MKINLNTDEKLLNVTVIVIVLLIIAASFITFRIYAQSTMDNINAVNTTQTINRTSISQFIDKSLIEKSSAIVMSIEVLCNEARCFMCVEQQCVEINPRQ